jgi:predicted O-methyltransferase YrrM
MSINHRAAIATRKLSWIIERSRINITTLQFKLMTGLTYAAIRLRGHKIDEGASPPEELEFLYKIAKHNNVQRVGEIGFHTGLSCYAFLKANRYVQVTSFDIGSHPYISIAKKIVDRRFPGRHTLVYGDSTSTVPEFKSKNPGMMFDLIFIDGGHEYATAQADISNMKALAHPYTIVIIDDLTPWFPWGRGPTRAWMEAIQSGLIIQRELYKDGKPVSAIAPPGARSWAVGNYVF